MCGAEGLGAVAGAAFGVGDGCAATERTSACGAWSSTLADLGAAGAAGMASDGDDRCNSGAGGCSRCAGG